MFSLKLKGKWSIRQRQDFHSNSDGITYPLPLLMKISIGMIFHSYTLITRGENLKGSQDSSFLAINAKGGEFIGPKQKDRTTILKFKNYFHWYMFQKKEEIISIAKTLLTAKGRTSLGRVFI
jgi:hypothetical protein